MASQSEREQSKKPVYNPDQVKPFNAGLRGEELVFMRPAIRHTNGARAALKAQQF